MKITPTKSGNGFTAGKVYTATIDETSWKNSLLRTFNDNGHERFISADDIDSGKPSAHLWDGVNWNQAGTWKSA